jgi:hypothetical protein
MTTPIGVRLAQAVLWAVASIAVAAPIIYILGAILTGIEQR